MDEVYLLLRQRCDALEKTSKNFQREAKRLSIENQRLMNENKRKNEQSAGMQLFQQETKHKLDQLIVVWCFFKIQYI